MNAKLDIIGETLFSLREKGETISSYRAKMARAAPSPFDSTQDEYENGPPDDHDAGPTDDDHLRLSDEVANGLPDDYENGPPDDVSDPEDGCPCDYEDQAFARWCRIKS